MIAAWLVYTLVVTALVSVAALIAERIALLRQLPSRWIWMAALLLSIVLPMLGGWQTSRVSEQPRTALVALVTQEAPPLYMQSPIAWVAEDAGTVRSRGDIDVWLLAGWAAMSVLVLATLSMGWIQLRRRLRHSSNGEVQGVNVTVSEDVGPAVLGFMQPRIVIPRWLLQQDAATQAVAIAHERGHMLAQDSRVLGAALLIAALVPWNLPIWWQLRRLRFAMEVDCDARVLRAGHSRSTYSTVLLQLATDLVPLRAVAAGLSESGSSLERRVRIMHAPLRKRWRLLATFLGSCSVALVAAATGVNAPPVSISATSNAANGLPLLPTPVAVWKDDEAMLAGAVGHFYPELLSTQLAGRPYVWAIVNEQGQVSQIDLDVRPSWVSEEEFARNWQAYLQGHGVVDSEVRQQLVLQLPIGRNYAVLAWVMVPGAVARDLNAPAFGVAPKQARIMESRMLKTADEQRRVIEHFDAAALTEGVPAGQELWFLIEPDGTVVRAGRRATITDPQTARLAMQKMFPEISVGYVARGTVVKDANGRRVPVSWQWLESLN